MADEGFGSIKMAGEFRDAMVRLIRREIERSRPRGRDGEVVGVDYDGRTLAVQYADEPDAEPVTVALPTGITPASVGQKVRVEGTKGGRYMAAILEGPGELAPETTGVGIVPNDFASPATPTGLTGALGVQSATVSWDPNTEVDMINGYGGYEIQVAVDAGFTFIVLEDATSGTTYALVGVPTGTTLYIRVRAVDAHNNVSAWTSASTVTFNVQAGTGDIADNAITANKLAVNQLFVGHTLQSSNYNGTDGTNGTVGVYLGANGNLFAGTARLLNAYLKGTVEADVFRTGTLAQARVEIDTAADRNTISFPQPSVSETAPAGITSEPYSLELNSAIIGAGPTVPSKISMSASPVPLVQFFADPAQFGIVNMNAYFGQFGNRRFDRRVGRVLTRAGVFSMADNTDTALTCDTNVLHIFKDALDSPSVSFNTSTGVITPLVAGRWQFVVRVNYTALASGTAGLQAGYRLNGSGTTTWEYSTNHNALQNPNMVNNFTTEEVFNGTTDTIQFRARHISGAARNCDIRSISCWFMD